MRLSTNRSGLLGRPLSNRRGSPPINQAIRHVTNPTPDIRIGRRRSAPRCTHEIPVWRSQIRDGPNYVPFTDALPRQIQRHVAHTRALQPHHSLRNVATIDRVLPDPLTRRRRRRRSGNERAPKLARETGRDSRGGLRSADNDGSQNGIGPHY